MEGHSHHQHMLKDFQKRFWISAILTIPIFILSPMIQSFFHLEGKISFSGDIFLSFFLSSIIFFYGGWPFLLGGVREIKNRSPGMMTLIGLAIFVAYFYSSSIVFGLEGKTFFGELASLIDIMLLGHWIEMKSVIGAGDALEKLAKLLPSQAHLLNEQGGTKEVEIETLKKNDKILIKPGEKIPADGKIIEGFSAINESLLTGESKPIDKTIDQQVIGGSINGDGSLMVLVEKTGKESFLAQMIKLINEAQGSKTQTQDLANKAAFWLTMVAIIGGVLTFLGWMIFSTQSVLFSLERTVTVMVITCPHALGLAVPLVAAVSTSIAASKGLLIRNKKAFEASRNIQTIVFDKTGTLTKGAFSVTDILIFDKAYTEEEIIHYAAAVEHHSQHPIAKGIVEKANTIWKVNDFVSIPGKGAAGTVKGKKVQIVSSTSLEENHHIVENERTEILNNQGKTLVYLLIDNQLVGAIGLADQLRKEAAPTISELKKMGIKCLMITGDHQAVAKWISSQLELDNYYAQVLPQEKSNIIKTLQEKNTIVAMTGDGVNDAPALAQANVGIAVGAGTDIAIETADIILIKSNPSDVLHLIKLAKASYKKMVQNLIWATGYNAVAIPLAAGVLYKYGIILSPAVGAILMSLSTVICAINAKLLSRQKL